MSLKDIEMFERLNP